MWVFKIDENGLCAGKTNIKKPEEGESLPEGCTELAPPDVDADWYQCRWNGVEWVIETKRPA